MCAPCVAGTTEALSGMSFCGLLGTKPGQPGTSGTPVLLPSSCRGVQAPGKGKQGGRRMPASLPHHSPGSASVHHPQSHAKSSPKCHGEKSLWVGRVLLEAMELFTHGCSSSTPSPHQLLLRLSNCPLALPPVPSPLAGAGRGDKGELVFLTAAPGQGDLF